MKRPIPGGQAFGPGDLDRRRSTSARQTPRPNDRQARRKSPEERGIGRADGGREGCLNRLTVAPFPAAAHPTGLGGRTHSALRSSSASSLARQWRRPRQEWRSRSRSSEVICSRCSAMRRRSRKRPRAPPLPPMPPNRIRHRTRSPSACQNVMRARPNSEGTSQFHRYSTIPPSNRCKPILGEQPHPQAFRFPG